VSRRQEWINTAVDAVKKRTAIYYSELLTLAVEIGEKDLVDTIEQLTQRLEDPFLFVIVGEVKSGKSSFINALLESKEEICPVSPAPMTDRIQQIVYGETRREEDINPYLKRVELPIPVLKYVGIVDTPGTNTIIAHHQEITERFVPASDLIIFVFEAKNPYRQSAWEFFDYIHESWQRKLIFILQQKDLLSEADLEVNKDGLIKHAKEKGVKSPVVFAVSAREEQEGKADISGFAGLRTYIENEVTGKKAHALKLSNTLDTGIQLLDKMDQLVELRYKQFDADRAFRQEVSQSLDADTRLLDKQINQLIENITSSYNDVTRRTEEELASGLGLLKVFGRTFRAIFSSEQSMASWLEQLNANLQDRLETNLRERLQDGIFDISERIQQMSRVVDMKIQRSKTILDPDEDIFQDIAKARIDLLEELRGTFKQFLQRPESFADDSIEKSGAKLAPHVATGTGLAIVGAMLTALTHGVVFDVTGGVLTAVGLLFTGISVGWQRRKIVRKFREEIGKGKDRLAAELEATLTGYISKIRERIEAHFKDFDEHLDREQKSIERLRRQSGNQRELIEQERKELKKLR
jgi:GTPase SAR1 family protein